MLRHPARGVRGRAIDLGGVLTRERPTTVASHATVGVDDDLSARQSRVGVGSAEYELARGIDETLIELVSRFEGNIGLITCSRRRS